MLITRDGLENDSEMENAKAPDKAYSLE